MTEAQMEARSAATIQARARTQRETACIIGFWLHLSSKGLIAPSGDRAGLAEEIGRLRRQLQ